MLTVNDLYLKARRELTIKGCSMPELEARELVGKAAGIGREAVMKDRHKYVPDSAAARFGSILAERLSGVPLAYILGEWDFLGVTLKLSRDVLIPRSDTETLALAAVELLKQAGEAPRLLDLCSGSGCVGIAAAVMCPGARVTFCDISDKAMDVARDNCRGRGSMFSFVLADALAAPPRAARGFNVIACNPPYITSAEWEVLDAEVRDHEPRLALDGGADGLDFYRSVSRLWRRCLGENGALLFETGHTQAKAVASMMSDAGFSDIEVIKDLSGTERVVSGRRAPKKLGLMSQGGTFKVRGR